MPKGYSISQIRLHWLVAVLVLAQFLNEDAIGAAWRAFRRGAAEIPGGPLVLAHVWGGVAILGFVLWRITLRLTRGAPPLPPEEPRMLRIVAAATHGTLYLLLLLVPVNRPCGLVRRHCPGGRRSRAAAIGADVRDLPAHRRRAFPAGLAQYRRARADAARRAIDAGPIG